MKEAAEPIGQVPATAGDDERLIVDAEYAQCLVVETVVPSAPPRRVESEVVDPEYGQRFGPN